MAALGAPRRGPTARASAAIQKNTAAVEIRRDIVAPGGALVLGGEPEADDALGGGEEDAADLPGEHAVCEESDRRRGRHEYGRNRQGTITVRCRDHGQRDEAEQDDVQPGLAGGWVTNIMKVRREPAAVRRETSPRPRRPPR